MITAINKDALSVLIDCLISTPITPEERRKAVSEARIRETIANMFDETGASYAESAGGVLGFLGDEDAMSKIREMTNDLGSQTHVVSQLFAEYVDSGIVPAPWYAWRIVIILRREKERELERFFLSAWCKHFGHIRGGRYEALAKRLLAITGR